MALRAIGLSQPEWRSPGALHLIHADEPADSGGTLRA